MEAGVTVYEENAFTSSDNVSRGGGMVIREVFRFAMAIGDT